MKRIFYSMALALCALMLSLPAQAKVYNAGTWDDLYKLFSLGTDPSTHTAVGTTDTIRLTANITFVTGVHEGSLCVLSNTTRTLDLNGYTLEHDPNKAISSQPYAITMNDNSVLNILDSRGGGQLVNNSSGTWALPYTNNWANVTNYRYSVSSACIANFYTSRDNEPSRNCTVNLYGGSLIAKHISEETNLCSSVFCRPKIVPNVIEPELAQKYEWAYMLNFNGGGYFEDPNMTVNVYGGNLGSVRAYEYTSRAWDADKATYDYYDSVARSHLNDRVENYLTYTTKEYYGNPVKVNLYGGNIGHSGMSLHALNCDKGFSGTLKDGTIYGIASKDHLNNFTGVADGVKVYLNGTQTTVNALKTQDLNDKTVRFAYEPEISVSGVEVTKDNCTDIMPWEEFKASFDYATNTLYLKTLSNPTNVLNGIQFADFDLRIVVDGYWRINGSIVGTNGDLTITSNHFALAEEDGDALVMKPGDNTAITLPDHRLTLTNRVRLLCYNNESGHTAQSAVKCHDMWVNNSWFDAWGKKPIVDCAYGSVVNATIKTGSFKNNDVIQVEPQFTQYYIFVQTNGDERGEVTGKGIYNEGTELTISATPKSGYYFDRWYEDGSTDATRTITVTQNATYTALFFPEEVINYYDVTVLSADETMGTVSGGGTQIEEGSVITITATPKSGYQFLYWKDAQNQVVPGSAVLNWTVKADEILTAHFRVAPPADAYNLWVCGTRVTGSNSNDILGDGVWNYDHENRVLTAMNHATYNISNDGFIQDLESSSGPLTVVLDYNIDVTCTTTDNTIRAALMTMKGMTFTGSTFHGLNLNVKDMNAGNMSGDLTITGHIDFTVFLSTPSTWGQSNINRAFWFSKNFIVNGATVDIGTSESTYKVSNTTNADLQLTNAEIISGALDQRSLYISDISPKYEINYLTPSLESLCQVGGFNSFYEGTNITLRAYPAPGYKFVSWSDGNTDNPRYMVMPAQNVYLDPIVEVDESIVPKGAIINASATEGQGTITNFTSGWYAEGTELTITAQPAEGYEFVQWSDGHETNPYYLTVEDGKNINITAMFCEKGQGIENIQVEGDQPQKIMMDGILYIVRDGKIYNAQGANVK